jgi:hypothetical protein
VIPSRRRILLAVARRLARELASAPGRLEPLPRARPRRSDRLVGVVTHAGLYLAVVAAIGAFFSAAFGSGTWQGWTRIAIGAVLAAEGALVAVDVRGARRLLVARLHARSTRRHGPPAGFVEALRWRLLSPVLALVSLGAVCGGLILVAMGAGDVV